MISLFLITELETKYTQTEWFVSPFQEKLSAFTHQKNSTLTSRTLAEEDMVKGCYTFQILP